MSHMLASVNNLAEALIAQQIAVDIIDLKQPAKGALGALNPVDVKRIVNTLGSSTPISATVGDLPMQAELIVTAVRHMSATGVDYIKIGFFPDQDWDEVIIQLSPLTQGSLKLIAVLFADQNPDMASIAQFAKAGFTGIMLDTMNKTSGSLTELMSLDAIQQFISTARDHSLLTGLAGSLRITDIPVLLPLQADYLGFRGALCINRQRTAEIDPIAMLTIKTALTTDQPLRNQNLITSETRSKNYSSRMQSCRLD